MNWTENKLSSGRALHAGLGGGAAICRMLCRKGNNYAFLSCYESPGWVFKAGAARRQSSRVTTAPTSVPGNFSAPRQARLLDQFCLLIMATGQGGSTSTADKLEEVLKAVRDVEAKVDSKLSEMKREIEASDDRVVKKMRLDTKPTFKKRGHEKQYLFNEQVRDKVDAAMAALKSTPPAVEKAITSLQEGEKLITVRQKNILIADRSEHGWATVAEYEEDELADDSDDEKRLFGAEQRAGRKNKQKSAKDARKKGGASKKPFRFSSAQSSGEHAAHSGGTAAVVAPGLQFLVPQVVGQGTRPPSGQTNSSQLGPCFYCGKMGHFRKGCPLLQNAAGIKST